MKTLIAALLLVSSSAFAQSYDATEVLLSILPAKDYRGVTPVGTPCEVSVRNLSNRVAVVASTLGFTTRSEVYVGAYYAKPRGSRTFLASVLTTTLTDKRENFVRTIAVTENTQYIAVGDIISWDGRTRESVIECIVNL